MSYSSRGLVFAHDHTFLQNKEGLFFSYGSYPSSFWSRYQEYVDSITVLARKRISEEAEGYVYSFSEDGVLGFHEMKNASFLNRIGLRGGKFYEDIKELVDSNQVVVCRLPSESGYSAALAAIELKKPFVVELVGCPYDAYYYRGGHIAKIYAPVSKLKVRYVCSKAKGVLYVSNVLREKYPAADNALSVVASNVRIDKIDCLDDVLNRKKSFLRTSFTFGLIGSFYVNYKGIDIAIAAVQKLRSYGYNIRLRVLGDGNREPLYEAVKKLGCSDSVCFDGLLPAGEPVRDWLRQCDFYMQPSRTEGMPRGLLEALSVGLPAVGSTAGGIPDLLPKEFLHEIGSPNSLANAMRRLISSDYEALVRSSLKTVKGYTHEELEMRRQIFLSDVLG